VLYDLPSTSTYATRLSADGVADEWVTQLLRQADAKVFKKYSQMKLQRKREALQDQPQGHWFANNGMSNNPVETKIPAVTVRIIRGEVCGPDGHLDSFPL
jgi:hypothetical protein